MAAAAYDERRGSANDEHTKAIDDYLKTDNGGAWDKDIYEPATPSSGWNNTDGASYSGPTTGMQADVWTKGAETSRAGSNDGLRSGDGLLDTSPSDDGTDRLQRVAKSTAIR